jgi:hypothetical protein
METPTLTEEQTEELIALLEGKLGVAGPFIGGELDFLKRGVWTKDEATGQVLQFPIAQERFKYLEEVVQRRRAGIADGTSPIFVVEKSRRMMMTWLFLALYLYDTLSQNNHANFIGSRKMESSAFLLGDERMLFMYKNIPAILWKDKPEIVPRGKFGGGYTRLECPKTGSYIQAIASGATQLLQYTASNILCDEFAFWDNARESWMAMRPTIEGGGHIDIISTPNLGSFMYDLINPHEESTSLVELD